MENNIENFNESTNQTSIDQVTIEELKSSQSIKGAILGGLIGAIAGAALWAIVTVITKYEIGYVAIGVGFLTGFSVRKLGRGFEKPFGYIGAIWSLIGCFVGNIFAILIMSANQYNISLIQVIHILNFNLLVSIVKDTFSLMDLVFYGIAVYEGYRFSFMKKDEVIQKLNKIVNSGTI